jgi:hypothetical protein
MKKVLAFLVGVMAGFLGLEVLQAPREFVPAARADSPARTVAAKTGEATAPPAAVAPSPVGSPKDAAATAVAVQPASEMPRVFFFPPPFRLYGSSLPADLRERLQIKDRSVLLEDAAFMARYREISRPAVELDLLARQWLLQLDPAKFSQIVELATEQAMTWYLRPGFGREDSLAKQALASRENAAKLAAILSPDELEAWAQVSSVNASSDFRSLIEAFASRGLPLPTREQLAALVRPGTQAMPDGQIYRTRHLDLGAAPESLNPQQRTYLINAARWSRASLLVGNLNSAKVRDPEVWEIWPE